MNKIRYLLTIALAFPLLATAQESEELPTAEPSAPPPSGELLDGVIAVVNEGVVLRSELEHQRRTIENRARDAGMRLPPDDVLQEQILEKLIVEEVQLQRADRIGIQISDQQLNRAISSIIEPMGIRFEDLPAELEKDGISYSDYRNEMRRQVIMDQLRRIEVMGRIAVSEREVNQCIADLEGNVVENSEYNLSHILVSVPESATNAQFKEAEEEANDIYRQLMEGADFAELAVRYSDSSTALEGGALGWLEGGKLPTLFFDIMDEMEAGDISEPVRNVSGYHLVRVNELRGANQRSSIEQMNVRHILIVPNEIIDDATAKQRLDEARERIQSGEDFSELAKLMSDDPGSAADGGDMGWTNPGTFVPSFEEVANQAEIGEVSEPFQSQFGWHILEVMGRRTYDNTEDLKIANCQNRIRNNKLASETELWTRRLRDEAYVDVRI